MINLYGFHPEKQTFLVNRVFKAAFFIIWKFVSKGLKSWYLWKFSKICEIAIFQPFGGIFFGKHWYKFWTPFNKEGFKKFKSIFFFFQWVFSGSFPKRDCFSGWKPYLARIQDTGHLDTPFSLEGVSKVCFDPFFLKQYEFKISVHVQSQL